jgi:hypothetical protein
LKTKKNIPEVIERVIEVGEIIYAREKKNTERRMRGL